MHTWVIARANKIVRYNLFISIGVSEMYCGIVRIVHSFILKTITKYDVDLSYQKIPCLFYDY